ncbi:MAG: CotS family spore coat protein, partial [Clostridiaceae bacterium]
MQGIDREAGEKYGLEVKSLVPYKDTYMLVTSQGRKLIRKMPFSPERLLFVHGAKEHLIRNCFSDVDKYLCTLSGEPYFI